MLAHLNSHNKQIANCSGSCAAIFYHQHIQFRNIGKQVLLDSKFNHKDCIGATFLAVKRASHLASPYPRTRTRPLDKKLCFQRAAYPKKCAKPLEVDEKSAQSNLGKLLQQPPHNWAITKWMYNLSLLNAQAWKHKTNKSSLHAVHLKCCNNWTLIISGGAL